MEWIGDEMKLNGYDEKSSHDGMVIILCTYIIDIIIDINDNQQVNSIKGWK